MSAADQGQGGHAAWLLAATGRYDVVLPVSGALAMGYEPPPTTGTTTIRAIHGIRRRCAQAAQAQGQDVGPLCAEVPAEDGA